MRAGERGRAGGREREGRHLSVAREREGGREGGREREGRRAGEGGTAGGREREGRHLSVARERARDARAREREREREVDKTWKKRGSQVDKTVHLSGNSDTVPQCGHRKRWCLLFGIKIDGLRCPIYLI